MRRLSFARQQRRSKPIRFLRELAHARELDEHLQTPILTSFWSQRLDLLEKDVDIQFITMLSEPN